RAAVRRLAVALRAARSVEHRAEPRRRVLGLQELVGPVREAHQLRRAEPRERSRGAQRIPAEGATRVAEVRDAVRVRVRERGLGPAVEAASVAARRVAVVAFLARVDDAVAAAREPAVGAAPVRHVAVRGPGVALLAARGAPDAVAAAEA